MADTLLPSNASDLEVAFDLATATRVDQIDLSVLETLKDPETCPAVVLPWLAWEYSVDTWSAGLTEAQKRAVIAAAPRLHRIKGTPAAVRLALEALGLSGVEIQEGMGALRHDGEATRSGAYTYAGGSRWALFRVIADLGNDVGLDVSQIAQIKRAILRAKNARSHLYGLTWRANITVDGGMATLSTAFTEHLTLSVRQGVRDGRYCRAAVPERYDRRGDVPLDGSLSRADRRPADTLPYALGHLRPALPISVAITATLSRPAHLPRDGRIRADGTTRRGRPLATIAPLAPVARIRPPRTGGITRAGWGPPRDGTLTYDGRRTRGGRYVYGTLTRTLEAA